MTPVCDPVDDKHAFLSPSGQLLVAAMSIHGKRRHGEDEEEALGERREGGSGVESEGAKEESPVGKEKSARLELDLFSDSPEPDSKAAAVSSTSAAAAKTKQRAAHVQSNVDDEEGYYKATAGEVINGQYRVLGVVGRGVFSSVLKCVDIAAEKEERKEGEGVGVAMLGAELGHVAVKVVRNNETMKRAAVRELSILQKLRQADARNTKFVVRLLSSTEHLGHSALVFEAYSMNLRQALQKFGKNVGISINAVRMYARQLLVALTFLREQQVVHADLKLDNILCSADLKVVKLCDFGSAFEEHEQDGNSGHITPYLISRFYRAPEVILGLAPLDGASDLFSLAVCLYELTTGAVMFPGRNNNDMLRLMLRCRGALPNKVVKAHLRAYGAVGMQTHFSQETFHFLQRDEDNNGVQWLKAVAIPENPASDCTVAAMLRANGLQSDADAEEREMVSGLGDLLDKCLALNRSKRVSASDALQHAFFNQE